MLSVCVRVRVRACVYMYVCVCVCAYMRVCIHMGVCLCMGGCMCVYNHFILISREMINCHQGNLEVALRTVVHNELGQNRSPTNMHLLAMLMYTRPEAAPKVILYSIMAWITQCSKVITKINSVPCHGHPR